MNMKLNDPQMWETMWENAIENSAKRSRRDNESFGIERWNNRAQQFAINAANSETMSKTNELLNWLEWHGALKPGFKILDVGAGSGRYAIPMAKMGCEVTALEPAEGMVSFMRERIEQENISNITIINKSWQDINIEKDEMSGKYDLVFASMTPGIKAPCDIRKMISASSSACYLSSHTKERWRHIERLWKLIYGESMPDTPGDFLYRFGLVYSLGYMPLTYYIKGRTAKEPMRSIEKISEDIIWSISSYIPESEMTEEIKNKINGYIESLDMKAENAASQRFMSSQAMLWYIQ